MCSTGVMVTHNPSKVNLTVRICRIAHFKIIDMEEKRIYYYISETMRELIEQVNSHNISRQDIIGFFHDGNNYIVVYEL